MDRSFVYPPSRYTAVRDWRFADFRSDIGPGWHADALARLLAGADRKAAIAEGLLREEAWDFFMAVFGEADTVSHHFWLFHDPQSPRHRPGFETAIRQVYERLDAAVGRLVAAAGEDVVVGVVSDHGFGGAGTGVAHLNNWLAEHGYLAWKPGGRDSLLKRAALSLTPERWRGGLFRALWRACGARGVPIALWAHRLAPHDGVVGGTELLPVDPGQPRGARAAGAGSARGIRCVCGPALRGAGGMGPGRPGVAARRAVRRPGD